jgi:hypothetical protein
MACPESVCFVIMLTARWGIAAALAGHQKGIE